MKIVKSIELNTKFVVSLILESIYLQEKQNKTKQIKFGLFRDFDN